MSKLNEDNPYSYSHVVDMDDDTYLVQGRVGEDELIMFRTVDNLLACERDEMQNELWE